MLPIVAIAIVGSRVCCCRQLTSALVVCSVCGCVCADVRLCVCVSVRESLHAARYYIVAGVVVIFVEGVTACNVLLALSHLPIYLSLSFSIICCCFYCCCGCGKDQGAY